MVQDMAPHCMKMAMASISLVTRATRTPRRVSVWVARLSRWMCSNALTLRPSSTDSAMRTSRIRAERLAAATTNTAPSAAPDRTHTTPGR